MRDVLRASRFLLALATAGAGLACGTDRAPDRVDARLETPAAREARLTLRPGLDVSSLGDAALTRRILIDAIDLHVADVRLLGPDPRIPSGGLPLIGPEGRTLSVGSNGDTALELPFSEQLLDQDGLAVYVRLESSEALGRASVVVRGRFFSEGGAERAKGLSVATEEGSGRAEGRGGNGQGIDPDGDPADCAPPPDGDGADGDPAEGDLTNGGTPTTCTAREALVQRDRGRGDSLPFELRGADAEDLLASLSASSRLDVVVGIPAGRWFTSDVVRALEQSLSTGNAASTTTPESLRSRMSSRDGTLVLETLPEQRPAARPDAPTAADYYVAESPEDLGWLKVRHELHAGAK